VQSISGTIPFVSENQETQVSNIFLCEINTKRSPG